ncbi:Receptor-type tyrosine-protein phosphatase gamma, partial [Varanus komodoensis]
MQIYFYNPDDFDSFGTAVQEKRIIGAMAVFFQQYRIMNCHDLATQGSGVGQGANTSHRISTKQETKALQMYLIQFAIDHHMITVPTSSLLVPGTPSAPAGFGPEKTRKGGVNQRDNPALEPIIHGLKGVVHHGEAVAVLNRCLTEVMGWMRAKLKLNPDKTEVLLVGGLGFGEGDLNLVLNGVALSLRDKVRTLGVLLNPELSLEAQVTAVARSTFFQLRLIHQLHPYLENDYLATVTHALVTSRLDFCNVLYVGLPLKTVWILQLVQNRAARLLTGTGRYVHMTPVLRQLHWLPIEVRAQFKVLVMTYNALNSLGPGYLKEHLQKETFLDPFVLRDLLPASLGSYYRYTGSLTTPPCSEIVEWIVFRMPVPISYRQLEAFYSIFTTEQQDHVKSVEYLRNNFRPQQSLNNRVVSKSAVKDAWNQVTTSIFENPLGTEASK